MFVCLLKRAQSAKLPLTARKTVLSHLKTTCQREGLDMLNTNCYFIENLQNSPDSKSLHICTLFVLISYLYYLLKC